MIAKRITAGICAIALTVGMGQSVGAFADDVSIGNDHVASAVSSTDDISEGKVKFYSSYSNTAESVTLKWKALDGADGYKLYRHDPAKDKWVLVANTKELTFEDTGLLSGKAYKYYIKAYRKENGKTTYSKDSELKFVTTRPDTVTFKVTTKKKGTAKVTWKKVRGATSYIVYYKNSASDEWTKVKTLGADARSYTKTGLAGKYHGRFAVRAVREYKGKTFNGKLTKSKIYNYPYATKYMDKKNCWTLKKAFKAAVIPHKNPNNVLPTDAKTPMEYYAKFGFKHGYGHCFVMASMFTEMARTLGYDAKQVWGYVLGSGGRRSIHSWVEVRKDGETYVCDCSFQGHYPKLNGFMFKYGTKKTWVYQLEGDVATES